MKIKNIIYVLIAAGLFFLIANWVITSREKAECQMWQKSYSVAKWQADQCKHYNLPLSGQVRPGTK